MPLHLWTHMSRAICPSCGLLVSIGKSSVECPECGHRVSTRSIIKTKTAMKSRAWQQFSKYIRLRDCIATTGGTSEGVCYTCGKTFPIESLQAGHMVSGRTNSVLFDEDNVRIQCYSCNVARSGMQGVFVIRRLRELAEQEQLSYEDALDYIERHLDTGRATLTMDDLAGIYSRYRTLSRQLEEGNSD